MNTPRFPSQPDPNADSDSSRLISAGLNPWRRVSSYAVLGCTAVGLGFSPVAFFGGLGMLVAFAGAAGAAELQDQAMRTPPSNRNRWLLTLARISAFACVFAMIFVSWMAALTQADAKLAAVRGHPKDVTGSLIGFVAVSLALAAMLGVLAAWSQRARWTQSLALMLYWACFAPFAMVVVTSVGDGHAFTN